MYVVWQYSTAVTIDFAARKRTEKVCDILEGTRCLQHQYPFVAVCTHSAIASFRKTAHKGFESPLTDYKIIVAKY